MDEFPPIFKLIDEYPDVLDLYYDMYTNKLIKEPKDQNVKYLCIMSPYNYIIVNDQSEIDSDAFKVISLVLPEYMYNNLENFKRYLYRLTLTYFKEPEYHDVKIRIEKHADVVNVFFTLNSTQYNVQYRSESEVLTEVLQYEFFSSISDYNYESNFEYSFKYGFRVKYSELSIHEYFENVFKCIYGNFKSSKNTNIMKEILHNIKTLNDTSACVSEELNIVNDEFLIFFHNYVFEDVDFQVDIILERLA